MSQTMPPELFPSHGPSIRAALEVADADGVTAQRVASARATALQLGLPDSVVEADLQYAQREAQARRIEQNSPFALWAARSKERAALARDDTDGLAGVFSTAKAFGEIRQYEPGFWEALGTYLKEGGEDTAENIVATVGAIAGKLGANDFADQVERLAKQREKRRPAPLESNSAVQNYAGDVVRALPQFAGGVLSYIAGGPLGAVMFGAAQTGGSQYRSLRQENVERDRAFMAAAATAGLSAPLDALGTGKFLNIFKASGARQIFQNAGIAVGTDFVTEWLQTYPEEAARIWGLAEKNGTTLEEGVRLFFDNFWEMTRQGWYEGFVSMPFGLIGGAGKIAADRRASRDAQAFAEQNTVLHDAVEASQTKQIAPDYMEDALDHASDVLAQSVYIPAQAALDLAGQGRDVLTPLGITLEEARKAAASGVDLEVKLSRVHARLDSAGMTAVNDILRQTPGAPNLRELSLIDVNDEVQAALSDARQRRRRTDAVRQEEQRLVREMVPLVGKEAAEIYGKLNTAQARAFEAAYGVDAAGLMRRRSVGLAGEDTDGDALRQAALYEQTPMGDAARASLERDVHDFGVAVDNIVAAGKLPSDPVKMLGQTPLVMQLLGRDTVTGKAAAQGGIYAAPHVFDGTHPNMTPEMWKQIPAAMADPIAVFDSDSPAGRAKGDLVFMLELTDANGATVVVPVALDVAKGRKQAHVNIVKSAYSKESGGVPSNHWFMRQLKKNARYVNGQKMEPWLRAAGAASPLGSLKDVAATNTSDNRIYTDADLVNLRQGNAALYQPSAEARDLKQRFAAMPLIEADSTQWFGPGKAIDADSRNMRKAVHDWARTAFPQGTTVANADTGWGVQVTPSGIKASLHHGYDELLARSVPFIPQIIESGIHLDSIEKKPGLMSHIFANKIRLDGQDYVVGFVLREDRTGNRFYDHELTKIISPDWLKPGRDTSEEALGHRTNRGISPDSLNADRFPDGSVVHAARANRGDVMNILRERLGVNDGTGQILFQPDTAGKDRARIRLDSRTAAIRIFKGADMSSIPHETAHIFVDDLRRVAADDGSIARDRLRADLEQSGRDATPFATILSGEVDAEGARAMLRDVREELASLEDSEAGLRDAAAAAGRGADSASMREDIAAARKQNTERRRELLPVERMLSGYVRHLDGLAQARRDMATLRRFAGMAEDGGLTAEQWREVQEYAARGFEQYLGEGRAPVKELDGVFSRMMRWLKNLYASWRQYVGADLDDDVRRVFDRLLATDEQIRNDPSLRAALELEQEFLADAGLTAAERRELEDLRDRAEAEVTARMDRAVARERGKRYRAAFAQAKESLQASPFWTFIREVSRRDKPLTDGEAGTGGINRDSLVEYLGEDMVKDIARKMPRLVNARGRGDTVDSLAMQYPLTDGDADALANLIYDVIVVQDGSVNKLAARQAEQALAEQDRAISPEDGLLAGDAYGQYLEAVEKAMRRLGKDRQAQNEQDAARRMEQESLPERYYRDLARREVADMAVAQLDAQRFVSALRRALNERSRAVQRGKPVEAVQAMQRARFAFAMMQEVRKVRELVDTVQKKARKAARVKPGTYPAAQTEAIRKLVSAFGLPAPQQAWDAQSGDMKLRDLVQQSVDDTEAIDLMPLFPDWLLDLANPDPAAARRGMALDWKALRPLEVEQVGNLLDFLVHSGREQSRTGKESLRARVQAIADEAAASMSGMKTNYASRRDSLGDDLDRGFSSIDTIEWQCRKADGFQNVMGRDGSTEGVMEREVYGPLRAATDRYHARLNSMHKAVMPHLVRLLQSAKAWEKKYGSKTLNVRDEKGAVVPVPEAIRQAGDPGWTAEMVIGMALNMGNTGNRERLRSSYIDGNGKGGLTYDMVSLLLGDDAAATLFELDAAAMGQMTAGRARRDGILSAADWQAIQGVWDVLGSQWADTQAAHKRLYGFAPQGIEPGAFAVRVGDETVRLPGGYYPIKYDPRLDMKMRAQEGKEDVLDRSEGIFGIPAARKGFTMGRVTHTGRSLRLGVQALQKHLVDSARFIELGYDVRMADRIINNPTFAAEYQRVFGMQDYDRFRPNLKGLVVDEAVPDSSLLKAAEKARKHLVYYALSMNLNTALMQLTAVFPAVGDVGLVNVSRGLAQLGTRGMGLVREVFAASPYMERRFRNIDDDLARKAMKFEPGRGMTLIRDGQVYTWEDVANLGMLPIAAADCAVTTAIWAGAYHKKMKELRGTAGWKMDRDSEYHSQAVAYADKIIAQSNPDNDALSKSAFARDKGIVRLFNAFSGATTKFAQRTRYMWQGVKRGRVTKWEFARMELYDMLLPALAMVVMKGLAQGLFTGEDDDNEELAKLALSTTMGQFAMAFPVVGNPAADMLVAAMGAGGGRRAGLSTALDTPLQLAGKMAGLGGKATRGGDIDGEKLVMSALDLGSYISKIPVGPVTRRAERGYEQWMKGEGTPLSLIMPRSGN
ncbi:Tat pathway signal sequence domain protein [Desulfovibrio piger ATCC 29098]|uniref:Tat pathway signal sequence domain protein n=2 Tax=Desulfovibrio piger TaxID=901 RepID=B6WT73_9BACT|nr:Tat pathway signal sequence domain protein [Desulfovibrio piger ATCC 29098]